jgi:hypothetical protein
VLQVAFAQVRPGIDCHDAHFPHVAPNGIWVNGIAFPVHNGSNLPVAQESMLRVQLVDPVLEANFLRGGRDRLVIQAGAIEAEEVRLDLDRQVRCIPFEKTEALVSGEISGQIFF